MMQGGGVGMGRTTPGVKAQPEGTFSLVAMTAAPQLSALLCIVSVNFQAAAVVGTCVCNLS